MWPSVRNWFDCYLFSPSSYGSGLLARSIRVSRYPYAVLRDLLGGQLNLRAMGLVYATLLSLIPAIAFSFAILTALGVHRDLQPLILEFFRPVGDSAAELTQRLMDFANSVRTGLVGSVGFALLLWTLIGTVRKVEDCFNFVWRVQVPRSFARRIAEYVGLLITGPVLIVTVITLSKLAIDNATRELADVPLIAQLLHGVITIAPYLIVVSLFTVLYMWIPNTRVQLRPALIGALTAGVLWAGTSTLFTAMVVYTSRLTIVYAGFAIVVAVLLWTYFGWLILLAGAQLSFYVQNPSFLRLGLQPLKISARESERLALGIMFLVGKAHTTQTTAWSVDSLAREFGMPGVAIAEVVEAMEAARLLIASEDENVFPARDIASITLIEILDVVRARKGGYVTTNAMSLPQVERLLAQIEASWHELCGDRTLRDLVDEAE
ncbi:MAG: YihY/virulence factor BrkB family protein [Steroidobacteraceae bacterium]